MFNPLLVHEYLILSAERYPDKEALICGGDRWTFRELESYSRHLASFFVRTGLKRQDRVVVFLDNSAETVISLYGTLMAGGIFIILDGSMKTKKLRYILRDSGAAVMITHVSKSSVVKEALADHELDCRILWVGKKTTLPQDLSSGSIFWNDVMKGTGRGAVDERWQSVGHACIDQDLAALIYTSGSTGEPKGVMTSHHNMVSAARSIIQYLENKPDDIILNALPLSFDYGLYQVIMAVMFGGTVVLERSFAYPAQILARIAMEKATGFPIVPTIAALLVRMRSMLDHDLTSLRYISNTAAALPVEHIRRLRAALPHVSLFSMYGLTECKRVSYLPPEELDRRPSSVGKAIPNTEVYIINEHGEEAAPGEVGELVVRGSHVMVGYWNSPELTLKTFRQGRFPGEHLLYSGDLFKKDEEGFLYFVGRKDDMIKSKGERVSPLEVENVLCTLEGVTESAVIGEPDEIRGQAIKAFIVCSSDADMTKRKVLKYCSENLQSFMVPKYIEFVDSLPKSPNGKVDKKVLKRDS
jgi:long-chain acyl-CoA synthetase